MKFSKVLTLLIIITGVYMVKPVQVQAQVNGGGGKLGVGVLLGEPTGISVKKWNNQRSAFDLGVAWSFVGSNDRIHLHADYLLHSWISDIKKGELAFYYGIGGRMVFSNDPTVGVRIPFGLNYMIEDAPVGLFAEAVPILDLTPATEFNGNGAIGVRYYF